MTPILLLFAIPVVASTLYLIVALKRPRLTPFQQIFADAESRILNVGLFKGGFTPIGWQGVGNPVMPHDLSSTVAVCDPAFDLDSNESMYQLESVAHLRCVAHAQYGMYPEDIGDKLGIEQVLELLQKARETPPAIEG